MGERLPGGLCPETPCERSPEESAEEDEKERLPRGALVPSTLRVEFASVTLDGVPTDESPRRARKPVRVTVRRAVDPIMFVGTWGS